MKTTTLTGNCHMKQPSKLLTMYDRAVIALRDGPLEWYVLGRTLWPPENCPHAWNYSSNGGPPAWVRTMGKIIKRLKLLDYQDKHNRRMIGKSALTPRSELSP